MAQAHRDRAHKEAARRQGSGLQLPPSGDCAVTSAIMIRKEKPIKKAQSPNKTRRNISYQDAMKESAQAELQAILSSGKIYGPLPEAEQIRSIGWSYDLTVCVI
jgi:hypothetical protein